MQIEPINIENSHKREKKASFVHQIYLVVKYLQAKEHRGTHATRNRALISGGGAKPYKQKGTGKARRGTNRSPLRRGGAVAFGPQPRSYNISVNKKVVKNIIRDAFQEAGDKSILYKVTVGTDKLKVSNMNKVARLKNLNLTSPMLVAEKNDNELLRVFKNLKNLKICSPNSIQLNKLLGATSIFVSEAALNIISK